MNLTCPSVFLPYHHLFVGFGTCQACSHLRILAVLCAWNILHPGSVVVVRPSLSRPCSNVTCLEKHCLTTFSEPHLLSPNIPLSPSLLFLQPWYLYLPKYFIPDYLGYGLSVFPLDSLSSGIFVFCLLQDSYHLEHSLPPIGAQ